MGLDGDPPLKMLLWRGAGAEVQDGDLYVATVIDDETPEGVARFARKSLWALNVEEDRRKEENQ